jgi:hypothetical protein
LIHIEFRIKSRCAKPGIKKQDAEAADLLSEGVFSLNECAKYCLKQFQETEDAFSVHYCIEVSQLLLEISEIMGII